MESNWSFHGFQPFLCELLLLFLREPGLREPEKWVEVDSREWGPREELEWEWGGEPIGLSTGLELKEFVVFSPSWESLDGLCTWYTGRRGDLAGEDWLKLLTSESVFTNTDIVVVVVDDDYDDMVVELMSTNVQSKFERFRWRWRTIWLFDGFFFFAVKNVIESLERAAW